MKAFPKLRKIAVAATLVVASTVSFPALASGIPVFDGANAIQNTITAMKQVAAYALQLKQFEEQIKSNMAGLTDMKGIVNAQQSMETVEGMLDTLNRLEDKLRDGADMDKTLISWYGSSGKSPAEFQEILRKRKAAGDQRVTAFIEAYNQNGYTISEANNSLQKMSSSIQAINGPTEGAQAIASAIGILIRQQNSVLAMMQHDALQKAEDVAKQSQGYAVDEAQNKLNSKRLQLLRSMGVGIPVGN